MDRTESPSVWQQKIPPHNLTEIVDAAITLVNNPATTLAEILQIVKGPDFPTYGIIHGRSGIAEAYRTGRGRFMIACPPQPLRNMTKEEAGHHCHRDSVSK